MCQRQLRNSSAVSLPAPVRSMRPRFSVRPAPKLQPPALPRVRPPLPRVPTARFSGGSGAPIDAFPQNFWKRDMRDPAVLSETLKTYYDVQNRQDYRPTIAQLNLLLDCCTRERRMQDALRIFQDILRTKQIPNQATFTSFITAYGREGNVKEALEWHRRMTDSGVPMDHILYGALVDVCARNGALHDAEKLLVEMKRRGLKPNEVIYTSLIFGLAKHGRFDDALRYFREMAESDIIPNLHTYTTLISMTGKQHLGSKAPLLFNEMKAAGITPDAASAAAVVQALSETNDFNAAYAFIDELLAQGWQLNASFFNPLLGAAKRIRSVAAAQEVLKAMKRLKVPMDHVSYVVLIGVGKACVDLPLVLQAYEDYKASGLPANLSVMNELIDCAGKHRRMDLAMTYLAELKAAGLTPDVFTYTSLINNMAASKRVDEAFQLIEEMKRNGVAPNAHTSIAIMKAHIARNDPPTAIRRLAQEAVLRGHANVHTYTMLIHYALKTGDLPWAQEIAGDMKARGFTPTPATISALESAEVKTLGARTTVWNSPGSGSGSGGGGKSGWRPRYPRR